MRLLLAGDFAIHSGFARVNESLALELQLLGWDIGVLAVNYDGDAHPLQQRYRLYPAWLEGDQLGVGRLDALVKRERPDVVLLVNDPWNVARYLAAYEGAAPVVAYMPVDGTSLRPMYVVPLNLLSCAIAYTQFGLLELDRAGLTCESRIIPHGIDLGLFSPIDRSEARAAVGMDQDTYAVLILDHNQVRKRLDIAFDAFARFARDKPETIKLVYHGPLESAQGWNIHAMAADLGIAERMIYTARDIEPFRGVKQQQLRLIYSMCDAKLSATSGEGWGLTTMEAMACGLPCVLSRNSALAEWAADAALMVDAPIPTRHAGGINTVGCVPHAEAVAVALDDLYWHPHTRDELRERGLALVQQERFRWSVIARQFDYVLRAAVRQHMAAAEPQEVIEPQAVLEEVPA